MYAIKNKNRYNQKSDYNRFSTQGRSKIFLYTFILNILRYTFVAIFKAFLIYFVILNIY